MLEAAGAGQGDNDEQQASRRDDLAERDRRPTAVMLEALRTGSANMASASAAPAMAPAT
jgi:hypothetical protein